MVWSPALSRDIFLCTVRVSTQCLDAGELLKPALVTVSDGTVVTSLCALLWFFVPDPKAMPIMKVSGKNLYVAWTRHLSGAYLSHDPSYVSFPVSTSLPILKAP